MNMLNTVIIVCAIGSVGTILLAEFKLCGKVMKRSRRARGAPGANCGACGFVGLRRVYAEKLANEGSKPTCAPWRDDATANKISEVLGVDFRDVTGMFAWLNAAESG